MDPVYLVLLGDYVEYYGGQEDYIHGARPRFHQPLQGVQSVEVGDAAIVVVHLASRALQLRARGREDALRWGTAWEKALLAIGGAPVRWGRSFEPRVAVAQQSDHSACPDATASTSLGALYQGPLEVSCRGKRETFYASIFRDRLECHRDAAEAGRNGAPRLRFCLNEVQDAEMISGRFHLSLADAVLILHTAAEVERKALAAALQAALGMPLESPVTTASHGRPELEEKELAAAVPSFKVLHQGTISMERAGRVEQLYFVLYEDRFEVFHNALAAGCGARPSVFWRNCISDFKVRESLPGFAFQAEEGVVVLRAPDKAEFHAWLAKLGPFLEETPVSSAPRDALPGQLRPQPPVGSPAREAENRRLQAQAQPLLVPRGSLAPRSITPSRKSAGGATPQRSATPPRSSTPRAARRPWS